LDGIKEEQYPFDNESGSEKSIENKSDLDKNGIKTRKNNSGIYSTKNTNFLTKSSDKFSPSPAKNNRRMNETV
jgi:hypothetical protein